MSTLRSELDPEFAALVMRCLRKDPDERPDAEDLTRALGLVRRARVEWPPPGLEQLHRQGALWARAVGRLAVGLFLFIAILGIHPAAARPCCADSPDRSPGWLVLKRLSMATPIHFDDPDALGIWYFLLDAAFLLLLAALIPLVVRTARLTSRLVTGGRYGYPLPVLARVAWDRHRDTGDLINLSGRYALATPDRQARQIQGRAVAAGAITLAAAALIASCLAWLSGWLVFQDAAATGVLPLAELAALAAPAAALAGVYLVLAGIDIGQRRSAKPVRGVRRQPLRADVLAAWMAAAGVQPPAERWSQPVIRAAGLLAVVGGAATAIVAAYGLIAVFGASARFAGDRALGTRWLQAYEDSARPGADPPALDPRTALVLVASIPLDAGVARSLIERRLTAADRQLLFASVGPAFCLNPREVLFGVAADRFEARARVARMVGVDSAAGPSGFDAEALRDGGLAGLRRRARFCERYFGDQASISPQPKATEGR